MATVADQVHAVLLAKADALVRRDADALSALIHAGFVYVNASGRSFDKAGYVETYCTSGRVVFLSQQVSEIQVRPFDGFAIATMSLDDSFRTGGQVVTGRVRSLCVLSLVEGRWQWAAGQTAAQG